MHDAQFISGLIIIGILTYAAMIHGMIYYRLRNHKDHGVFSIFCLLIAAYSATDIFALYFTTNITSYITTSKLSSVFVIPAIIALSWFTPAFLHDNKNILLKLIAILLSPFFVLNLVMSNGILWSSIDGVSLTSRPLGSSIMHPVNPVISLPKD